jgi:hypothetical protein
MMHSVVVMPNCGSTKAVEGDLVPAKAKATRVPV